MQIAEMISNAAFSLGDDTREKSLSKYVFSDAWHWERDTQWEREMCAHEYVEKKRNIADAHLVFACSVVIR